MPFGSANRGRWGFDEACGWVLESRGWSSAASISSRLGLVWGEILQERGGIGGVDEREIRVWKRTKTPSPPLFSNLWPKRGRMKENGRGCFGLFQKIRQKIVEKFQFSHDYVKVCF